MSNYREALETLSDLACELEYAQKELAQLEKQSCQDAADARWEAADAIFKILNAPRGDKLADVVGWVCAPNPGCLGPVQVFFHRPEGDAGKPSQGILNASHMASVLNALRNGRDAKNEALKEAAKVAAVEPSPAEDGKCYAFDAPVFSAQQMMFVIAKNGTTNRRIIADTLNLMGYRTEMGRAWTYQTVGNVINGKSPDPEKREKPGRKIAQP